MSPDNGERALAPAAELQDALATKQPPAGRYALRSVKTGPAGQPLGYPWSKLWQRPMSVFSKIADAGPEGVIEFPGLSTAIGAHLCRAELVCVRLETVYDCPHGRPVNLPRYYVPAPLLEVWLAAKQEDAK